MDPVRLASVIHQAHSLGRQPTQPWQTSNQARVLATRKQIEPKASGRQTCWFAACAVRFSRRALPQLMLKKRVPASCTALAHQSIRRSSKTKNRRWAPPRTGAPASTASRYVRNPADVKNREPAKKVIESQPAPTAST